MDEPTQPKVRPGMSHVVRAGERLTIRDSEGQEIEITGRESEKVMAFLIAFDNLRMAQDAGASDGPVIEMLRSEVTTAWRNMPGHVLIELPSFSDLAPRV